MPIRKIVAAEGQYYHVYNRGALRTMLFFSPTMYHLFLQLLEVYAEQFHISIIAVCLMPNHFHIVIRVDPGGRVDLFMHLLCGVFSKRINWYLKRTGTIFEGRYHMKHVTSESYFKCLCRYVHRNPVKAGLTAHPADWDYSDARECLGGRKYIKSDHAFITSVFGSAVAYEAYLLDNMHSTKIDDADLARDLAEMKLV